MIAVDEATPRERSLTVSCVGGLGNRLRVLVTIWNSQSAQPDQEDDQS